MTSKFTIKEAYLVGKESYLLNNNDFCSICRNHLEDYSIYIKHPCQLNNSIIKGVCNHQFHYECINNWISKNNRCPNCFIKWEVSN